MDTANATRQLANRRTLGMGMTVATDKPTQVPARAVCSTDQLVRAFNELRDTLISTLWHMIGNKDDAQDAAQDTFLKCWRAQQSLKDIQNLRAWIFRIALNVARDRQSSPWHRRSHQFNSEDSLLSENGSRPEQIAEKQEEEERLRRALHRLRQEEKEVFLLRQNSDLTFEEIAVMRHRPVSTIKTQMRRALHKLRRHLAVRAAPRSGRREMSQARFQFLDEVPKK